MEIKLEENKSVVLVKFICGKDKQKLLIHALLKCSELSLNTLASILRVTIEMLKDVYSGVDYFKREAADNLLKLFLIRFADDITFNSDMT